MILTRSVGVIGGQSRRGDAAAPDEAERFLAQAKCKHRYVSVPDHPQCHSESSRIQRSASPEHRSVARFHSSRVPIVARTWLGIDSTQPTAGSVDSRPRGSTPIPISASAPFILGKSRVRKCAVWICAGGDQQWSSLPRQPTATPASRIATRVADNVGQRSKKQSPTPVVSGCAVSQDLCALIG